MGCMMKVILVGQSNGLRQIRWGAAFLVACALGVFSAVGAAAISFALSGTFSLGAVMIGFFAAFISVGIGVQRALKLPVDDLESLNGSAT